MKVKWIALLGLLAMGGVLAQHSNSAQNHALRNSNSPNYIDPNQQQPADPTIRWATRWGAIAGDPDNPVVGAVTDLVSKRKAKEAAIQECENRGGSNCRILLTYHNQCAVIVTGSKGTGTFHAESIEVASDLGMKDCQFRNASNCRVYYSGCSMPVRIQ